jgi:hypothetical protein
MRRPAVTVQIVGAARLLLMQGGRVQRDALHHLLYWEDVPYQEQHVLSWPPGTIVAYVSPNDQEDSAVLFAVFLLPGAPHELHLVYDYRPGAASHSLEEYFTLQIARAQQQLFH